MHLVEEYTLIELGEVTGLPERTLRLYRTKRLLPPPETRGRRAVYTTAHLSQLRKVQSMAERGFPLQVIAAVLDSGLASAAVVYLLESLTSARTELLDEGELAEDGAAFDPLAIAEVEEAHPGLVNTMVEKGLVHRLPNGKVTGDAFGMAVLADLAAQGMSFPQIATFAVAVSQAGESLVGEIESHLHPKVDDQLHQSLIDAATVVFRETLRNAVRR